MFVNFLKHLWLILRHKWIVFKLCTKIGMPWRGFIHDLSKFSFDEFWESVRYYQGNHSPIPNAKREKGYSIAWLHHFGRNKHHYEYWYDPDSPDSTPIIPYKYTAEMICDQLSAGIIYNGKNWNKGEQLKYWERHRVGKKVNQKISDLLLFVFTKVSKDGINKTITKKNLKKWYKEYTGKEK